MEELLEELSYWQKEANVANEHIKSIKEELEKDYLTEDGYKDEEITISYSKPSCSTTIDVSRLHTEEPELYKELLEEYSKTTKRKGSYRYTFK